MNVDQKTYITCIISFMTLFAFAQDQRKQTNDTLDADVVNVVKPYTPKISDAFKVKAIPTTDDATTTSKKEIRYNIFSIPVASIFTPAKGKAAAVEKTKKERLFTNYASLGFGNYTTLLGEVYLNHAMNRSENVGGYISHHSSQGGIDGVKLDDDFMDTKVNINYAKQMRDYTWNVDAGYKFQSYNWYGIPNAENLITETQIDALSPQHKFHTFDFGGEIELEDRMINSGSVRFRRFADDLDSGENRFVAKANFDVAFREELINTTVKMDYLGGRFGQSYLEDTSFKYGNFQIGIAPIYPIVRDEYLKVDVGFATYYMNDTAAKAHKFYIYPKVTASYRLVDDMVISYGGIEGDLEQNSYQGFASENPFVSPTLVVQPTSQQYNAYLGLKGKLSNTMNYNLNGSYYGSNNQALYLSNAFSPQDDNNYSYNNSFSVVYDNVKTLKLFGELNVDIKRNLNLGLKVSYYNYTADKQEEAWNLPDFEASLFLDYQITAQWFAGANLFYVGERLDNQVAESTTNVVSLESYFDANAHVGYRINERWTAYVKANNIANQVYNRWLNYPVQGIQVLGGASYKFDF
ncbi:MAG: TonB-dependent receptor [Flavobacteriaceae bacterium]|nr:TonB-dependent receptor [Flavobacteriaceae bacterium]